MQNSQDRIALIKEYLTRLSNGEDLESVQADFVKNFSNVEAMEIMNAEQELINSGVPLEEIQRLCDVHSALFHGSTREEKIANAEKAVAESIINSQKEESIPDKNEVAAELIAIPGHPLNTLHRENETLKKAIKNLKKVVNENGDVTSALKEVQPVTIHYAKKGDLLYPHLKVEYGVTGPSNVMWTVDDEIRDELNSLIKNENHDEKWHERLENVLKRIEEMIYKEENILFPASAITFNQKDWEKLYFDLKDYLPAFGIESETWKAVDEPEKVQASLSEEIELPGGKLSAPELQAIMKTLPLEITFIDKNDLNKYFNEGPKVFKRPSIALGHDVFSCHPPKVEKAVRKIIDDFKNNKRDKVEIWMEKQGKPFLVTYMAVRDDKGEFIGTMELVQDMEDIQKHYQK